MAFGKLALTAAVGMSLVSAPALAQSTSAASLSVAAASTAQTTNDDSDGGFSADWIVPGIIIVGVLVVLAFIYLDQEDEEVSISI